MTQHLSGWKNTALDSFLIYAYRVNEGSRIIQTFLTVVDGKIELSSLSKLGAVRFLVRLEVPAIIILVLLKFNLRKLEFNHPFNSLTHEDDEAVW